MDRRLTRRAFAASPVLGAATFAHARTGIGSILAESVDRRKIPCAVAMVADSRRVLYEGAFGTRDAASGVAARTDSIFAIASMTKAITSSAALQLVEAKRVDLDEPAERHLPELRGRRVLEGFDSAGRARLRPPSTPVTLRHLLTHTSGLCYAVWDQGAAKWQAADRSTPSTPAPLMFDPGARWQYGQGVDLVGRLVEAVSGLTLEDYFQKRILGPLGMKDTSFMMPAAKFDRLVTGYRRQPDGSLAPNERKLPDPPKSHNGGGGLYSTAPDYIRFLQAILRRGEGLVSRQTFRLMAENQIGDLRAGYMKSTALNLSSDVDVHPGESAGHSLAFVVARKPYVRGRAAGSLAWAGMSNTYFWADLARDRCAVLLMQYLPFVDREAVGLLGDFERAVYSSL